jgi:hypothetical protein
MTRLSGLLFLAMAGLLLACSESLAQAVTAHAYLLGVRGLEWNENATFLSPFDGYLLQHRLLYLQ